MPPVVGADGKIITPGRVGIELDYGHGLSGGRTPFLRAGEQAKVIAINRATGYIGTALVEMHQSGAGTMQFVPVHADGIAVGPVELLLTPPKLKFTVKRTAEIKYGATSSKTTGVTPSYIIGFEGSGLTSDKMIDITTEWTDLDGSALPEDLPGFTGRLAMTAVPSGSGREILELPDGGQVEMSSGPLSIRKDGGLQDYSATSNAPNPKGEDRTGFFPVNPGKKTVVVRLPDKGYDMNHFYLHVDAQPLTRNVDFTGPPGSCRPELLGARGLLLGQLNSGGVHSRS